MQHIFPHPSRSRMFSYFLVSVLVVVEAVPIFTERVDTIRSPLLQRSLFGIIWSCISTIIICAWTSVHPNVPPPNAWKARWNRLSLMFWMIIAPELVLAWAVRQFFAAREIRDEYNRSYPNFPEWRKWTLKHGHFLEMGGFSLVDPAKVDAAPSEQKGTVLTLKFFKENYQKLPKIRVTAIDIEDRSKGDALSKIIAILQTTWFIIQCIARGQQRLALTELELVTLALASLNAMTFAIWWHKPLGVQEPVKIYFKVKTPKVRHAHDIQRVADISFVDVISKGWSHLKVFATEILEFFEDPCEGGFILFLLGTFFAAPIFLSYIVTFPVFVVFPIGIVFLLKIIKTKPVQAPEDTPSQNRSLLAVRILSALQTFRFRLTSTVSKFVGKRLSEIFAEEYDGVSGFLLAFFLGWYILLPILFVFLSFFIIMLIPLFGLLFVVSFVFTAVFGIFTTSSIHSSGASHVPPFYAPHTSSDRWSRMAVFALFGVIFGGLHCIGWNFKFPTHSEQIFWRTTSLAITIIPLIVAPIDFLLAAFLHNRDAKSYGIIGQVGLLTLDLIMTILLFVYVPARLFLIAQALALLRSQPASALSAVDWTKYVPHLFSS